MAPKARYAQRGRGLNHAVALYMDGIRDGRPKDAMAENTGAGYRQHSTGVPDGKDGFIRFFETFVERNPKRDIRIVRALEDGRYVFLHVFQDLNDGAAQWVTADFFALDDDDRIVEHWDVIEAYAPKTASGHSNIDGATTIADRERTEANKAVVRSLIEDGRIEDTIADDCIRHAVTGAIAERGLSYDEIVLLVGEGNFVATLCRARRNGEPVALVDVFRLEGGRVVEHWEANEPVPPDEELVNSGKF